MTGLAFVSVIPTDKTFYTKIGKRIHECKIVSYDIWTDKVTWKVAGRGNMNGKYDRLANGCKIYHSITAARLEDEWGIVERRWLCVLPSQRTNYLC